MNKLVSALHRICNRSFFLILLHTFLTQPGPLHLLPSPQISVQVSRFVEDPPVQVHPNWTSSVPFWTGLVLKGLSFFKLAQFFFEQVRFESRSGSGQKRWKYFQWRWMQRRLICTSRNQDSKETYATIECTFVIK